MEPFVAFGLLAVAAAAIVALLLVFLYLYFSREVTTRAAALNAVRDRRELIRDQLGGDGDMMQLYETLVTAVLDPKARAPGERPDVDLDLHMIRKQDAVAIIKLLLSSARFVGLRPVAGASENIDLF